MARWIPLLALLLWSVPTARAEVIGHREAAAAEDLAPAASAAVAELRWFLSHGAWGVDLMAGLEALHGADPARYPITLQALGTGHAVLPPPARVAPGTLAQADRGNPGWAAKYRLFDDAVRRLGWRAPAVDAAMDLLCCLDPTASPRAYLNLMTALERDHPGTRFVYLTMPLQADPGANAGNMLAHAYNQAVRAHCAGSGRVLLDLADVLSHDPLGAAVIFQVDGVEYGRTSRDYTDDGRRLNAEGARRAALAWYAAAAAVAERIDDGRGQPSAAPTPLVLRAGDRPGPYAPAAPRGVVAEAERERRAP
ncbi:MAG TPA: hypothetical protein P5571_12845 [Candidatus Krumholzibacteria bacterium]|mgnify:CR=1 FL=1|nr:hypothetical protein [Candidatus Krumholzibacteria bacterium]HRX52249.1 hypothetical protein [Candidatus Krumholzibacteria bacterium]